ncbi:MAG: HAD family phosphatase [Ignisphaera sp.]
MKNIYVIVFDVDGTLTPIRSSWQFIHIILNTIHRVHSYARLFLDGIITYDEWIALEVSMWKGLHSDTVRRILEAIPWRSGIEEIANLVKKYKDRAMIIAVSGGFDYLCERAVKELGFDAHLCVKLQINEGRLTGFASDYPDYDGKGRILLDFLNDIGVDIGRAKLICVGDNINDINLFEVCDIAIAFCANENVKEYADIIINTCNVRFLARLLDELLIYTPNST